MMGLNRKKTKYIFFFIGVVIIMVVLVFACTGNTESKIQQRAPVNFTHDTHTGYASDCLDCHHQYKNGDISDNVLDESDLNDNYPDDDIVLKMVQKKDLTEYMCAYCHNSQAKIDYQEAFHRQCIGCHEKSGGPVMCGGCHIENIITVHDQEM